MKRYLCTLLTIALLLSCFSVAAAADDAAEYNFRNISVVVDKDGSSYETMISGIVKDGDVFVRPDTLEVLTRYRLTEDENRLLYSLGSKYVQIDTDAQTLKVNLVEQPFPGTLQLDGYHYLPMSELLPWLNVQCYVDDTMLHIDSDILSYWEVIADFDYLDYYFDLAEYYGDSAYDVVTLCSIHIFDYILNLSSCWKHTIGITDSDANYYEYEIYKECFRDIVLPDTGSAAVLQSSLSELSDTVSAASQAINGTFENMYNQKTYDKVKELFGEDFAEGFDEIPYDAAQTMDEYELMAKLLKYTKTVYVYTRIATSDTTAYATTLDYIYLGANAERKDGAAVAADSIVPALESKEGAIVDAGQTILEDIAANAIEEVAENVFEDTVLSAVNSYLSLIDATLSLVWPVNEAFNEVAKMTFYQSIQYDAMNAYFSIPTVSRTLSTDDLLIGRTSALIFLKTAKKCYQAQQELFDVYGGDGILDLQIELIDKKILEFELASLAEERDSIIDKSADAQKIRENWSEVILLERENNANADAIIGDWYAYQETEDDYTDIISRLSFYEDGSARLFFGYYATDHIYAFDGGWELLSSNGNAFLVRLSGTAGYQSVDQYDVEPYSGDILLTLDGNQLLIECPEPDTPAYWLDSCWHEKDLDYYTWLDRVS